MWKYIHVDEMYHGGPGSGRWKKGTTGNTPHSRALTAKKYYKYSPTFSDNTTSTSKNNSKKYTDEQIESIRSKSKLADQTSKVLNDASRAVNNMPTKRKRMDLSKMSDKELNDAINRELRERQYNDLFSKPSKAEKGKQIASGILGALGATVSVAGGALGIAVSIMQLKNKGVF